ncbi:hypothetical protein MW887_001086 [Aspergillus wentii]|nr:hypothetical protein MW887_001086 [Aspergillus wentii]
MYPGGTWQSNVLLTSICSNTSLSSICYGDEAGLFNADKSDTWDNDSVAYGGDGYSWEPLQFGKTNAVQITGVQKRAFDSMDIDGYHIPSTDINAIKQGYQTYPGGKSYPLEVGTLSLGCDQKNDSFTRDDLPSVNGTFVTSYMYDHGSIQSYSFGLHIGSGETPNIPGSLFLGGYDKSRVLGEVSAQPYEGGNFPITLLDIGLDVVTGGSPWNFTNKGGLLAGNDSSLNNGITVFASPADPYLFLPKSSCDAITAELPVTYQEDFGLYFWNTTHPQYSKIVTSPSVLAFTFSLNGGNTNNFTINVPFALLNLTLSAPLVEFPTPYFPCFPTNHSYVLGRAFLQAAFMGVNWSTGVGNWFLAQSTGPQYFKTPSSTNIAEDATTISPSDSSWEATWDSYWTPLDASSTTSSTSPTSASKSSSSAGLSTGAKAGVGIGCAAAGIAAIAMVAWIIVRRRRYKQAASRQANLVSGPYGPNLVSTKRDGRYELSEGGSNPGPFELGTRLPEVE